MTLTYAMTSSLLFLGLALMMIDVCSKLKSSPHRRISLVLIGASMFYVALDRFASSAPGTYAAILMDMRMPEMDGLEATRRIRELPREDARTVPIIALTANAFDEDVQRSMQAGLDVHLSKPVKPEKLFTTLEELIKA